MSGHLRSSSFEMHEVSRLVVVLFVFDLLEPFESDKATASFRQFIIFFIECVQLTDGELE